MKIKKMMARVLAGSMLAVNLMATPVFAADGSTLSVRVSGENETVAGVSVMVNGKIETTDENGLAVFEGMEAGQVTISVAGQPAKYLAPEDMSVHLGDKTRTVNVTLEEKDERIAPIAVWQSGTGIDMHALGMQAFVLEEGRTAPEEGVYRDAKPLGTTAKDELLAAALYYGCGGPGFEGEVTKDALQSQQQLVIQIWAGRADDESTAHLYTKDQADKRLKQLPNWFMPYTYSTDDVTTSAAVSWMPDPKTAQEVNVVSSNPEWTDGRDCYSRAGAIVRAGNTYAVTDDTGRATLGEGKIELVSAPYGYDEPEKKTANGDGQIVVTPKKADFSPLCYIAGTDGEGEYEVRWYKENSDDFSLKTAGAPDMSWIILSQKVDKLPEEFIGASDAVSTPAPTVQPTETPSASPTPTQVSSSAPAPSSKPTAEKPTTMTVGHGNVKIEAPREIHKGESVTVTISSPSEGTSGRVRLNGLKITKGADGKFATDKSFILVLGSSVTYECEITADAGETAGLEVYDVKEVTDGDSLKQEDGAGAKWELTVSPGEAAPSPEPTSTVDARTNTREAASPSPSPEPSVQPSSSPEAADESAVPSVPVSITARSRKVALYDRNNPPTHMLTFDGLVSGDPVPEGGLPYGTLVVSSVRPPLGSAAEKNPVVFGVNENTKYTYGVLYHDRLMSGATIQLQIADGEEPDGLATLAGAKFEIIPKDGGEVLAASIETNEKGVAHTKDGALPYGSYTLKIVEAPEGFEMPEQTEIPFTVTSSSAVNVGTMTVSSIKAAMTGKRISGTDGQPVSGVPFRVTSETNGNIYTAVTGVDGRFTTAQLPYDNYLVEELSGASNREMEKAKFRVAVRESGMLDLGNITKNGPQDLDPKYIPDTAAPLQKPDPQHPDQIITTDGVTGQQTVSTVAPSGSQPTPVPTGAGAGTITSATATPTPVPTPVPQPSGTAAKTDDETSPAGMYVLMALAGGAMVWMLMRRKRRGSIFF